MRKKTPRKTEFNELANCIGRNPNLKGQWHTAFEKTQPLVVELGSGKTEFGVALAQLRPDINYLGIDAKTDRLWFGARRAIALGVPNIRFLWDDIARTDELFAPGEVDALWITFPDPYPKARHARRRMTGPEFIAMYRNILKPGGLVQFKTDNVPLFDFTLEVLQAMHITPARLTRDLHRSDLLNPETSILTSYERRFIAAGLPIHYMAFTLE